MIVSPRGGFWLGGLLAGGCIGLGIGLAGIGVQHGGRNETRVAVLLGGRSPEHDVSVITGLQALAAIDQQRFMPFPVYISPRGQWFVGEALAERRNYLPDARTQGELTEVTLSLGEPGKGRAVPKRSGSVRPAGRAGRVRCRAAGVSRAGRRGRADPGVVRNRQRPYTGMRTLASALLMDKAATKRLLRGLDIPLLPYAVVTRGADRAALRRSAARRCSAISGFPASSSRRISAAASGSARPTDVEEVRALLPAIFRLDRQAVIEPFVPNLVEYNLAVARIGGALRTSAIEKPKRAEELLDFRQKYLSGGDGKIGGSKGDAATSQGMLSLTREINPALPAGLEDRLAALGGDAFEAVDGTGAPRIDFYCNEATGEVWLNEVNPMPGLVRLFPVGSGRPAARLHGAAVAADRRSRWRGIAKASCPTTRCRRKRGCCAGRESPRNWLNFVGRLSFG